MLTPKKNFDKNIKHLLLLFFLGMNFEVTLTMMIHGSYQKLIFDSFSGQPISKSELGVNVIFLVSDVCSRERLQQGVTHLKTSFVVQHRH